MSKETHPMADRVNTTCPCCGTRLVVETTTGEILAEERPAPDREKTFDDAFREVKAGSRKREELFSKAFDKTRRLDELLEKKFEEARKKAKDQPAEKPPSPFDAD
jgi:hypothetical protein